MKKVSTTFCEQKVAKKLCYFDPLLLKQARTQEQKFFASFFQKRSAP